jgi:hypothetical protein
MAVVPVHSFRAWHGLKRKWNRGQFVYASDDTYAIRVALHADAASTLMTKDSLVERPVPVRRPVLAYERRAEIKVIEYFDDVDRLPADAFADCSQAFEGLSSYGTPHSLLNCASCEGAAFGCACPDCNGSGGHSCNCDQCTAECSTCRGGGLIFPAVPDEPRLPCRQCDGFGLDTKGYVFAVDDIAHRRVHIHARHLVRVASLGAVQVAWCDPPGVFAFRSKDALLVAIVVPAPQDLSTCPVLSLKSSVTDLAGSERIAS